MLIDSNGKLFGKVSIIDIAIILVIIIALGGIYVRKQGIGKAVTADSQFNYTLKVNNIRQYTVDGLKKSIGLKFSLNEKQQSEMGELLDVSVSPAVGPVEKIDGTVVNAEIPDRYDVVLKFKVMGKVNDKGYYTPQLKEITAGTSYNIKSKYCTVFGIVQNVTASKEETK